MKAGIFLATIALLAAAMALPTHLPADTEREAQSLFLHEYEKQLAEICDAARASIVQVETQYPPRWFNQQGREVPADSPDKKFSLTPPRNVASGFIVTERGHIVTLISNITGHSKILVRLPGGSEYEAQLAGMDKDSGIAVIKIDGSGFKPAAFGKSSELKQGHVVACVGNPFGLRATASFGTVSGLNRSIRTSAALYAGLMQNTAPSYPGDSGGLVVNSRGEAVGIVVSTYRSASEGLQDQLRNALLTLEEYEALTDPERGGKLSDEEFVKEFRKRLSTLAERQREAIKSLRLLEANLAAYPAVNNTETLSFAIPLDAVADVIDKLVKTGKVVHPLLGVKVREIDEEYRGLLGLKNDAGMLVEQVIKDGPADRAGVRDKDIILTIDGRSVSTLLGLKALVEERQPGDKVTLALLRAGARISIEIELGARE